MHDNYELYRSSQDWLPDYVRSSFQLSGLAHMPGAAAVSAHRGLLMCRTISISNVEVLAAYLCPAARWRMSVDPADRDIHDADRSGRDLQRSTGDLLALANAEAISADELLLSFVRLQPFTSGNGRIGRALWMWRTAKGTIEEFERLRSMRRAPGSPHLHS